MEEKKEEMTDEQIKNELLEILDTWVVKSNKAGVLEVKYKRCSSIYKNADKGVRATIAICSLASAYMISFQNSGDTTLGKNSNHLTTVFYYEMLFGFSAAVISIIAQVISFPSLIDDNERKSNEFKNSKLYCKNQSDHCKWVDENIINKCPEILNLTIIDLRKTSRSYESRWQDLTHHSECCCGCCNIGEYQPLPSNNRDNGDNGDNRDHPPPHFEGGDVEAIQLSPALRWIQTRWGSPKKNIPKIELCECKIVDLDEIKIPDGDID